MNVEQLNGSRPAANTGRKLRTIKTDTVTMAHGGGGKAMRDLIDDVFIQAFDNPAMGDLEDQARLTPPDHLKDGRLAFTTDSFVVDPLFFPGGNIGTLAVNGTVGIDSSAALVPPSPTRMNSPAHSAMLPAIRDACRVGP